MEELVGFRGIKGFLSIRFVCVFRFEIVVERMLFNWMFICLY